jgi:hypothetical protein
MDILFLSRIITIYYEIANIAYMNNITWLANNRTSLSHQLQIADSFNHLTNIIVNPKKAKLIVINNSLPFNSITYGDNNYEIKKLDPDKSTRFLGVWIVNTVVTLYSHPLYNHSLFLSTSISVPIFLNIKYPLYKHKSIIITITPTVRPMY